MLPWFVLGENLDTLFITTGNEGLSSLELKETPLAGSLFKTKPGLKDCWNQNSKDRLRK